MISCEKEELPISPVDRGGVKSFQVEMGNNYENQIWVDFESGEVVASQNRFIWDIAFEGSGENGFVYLNGGKMAKAALSDLSWEQTTSKTGLNFQIDISNGDTDSLAIGDWQKHKKVIVIDLGYKESGTNAGFLKLQMLSLENGVYKFRYASLDGSNEKQAQVNIDADYNTLMFSFAENKTVGNQPQKNEYDLFFTQYSTHLYENGSTVPVDYLVNGALINPTNVTALYLKEETFENITEEIILKLELSTKLDAIGYDWKAYNFDSGVYQVDTKKAFVLKDRKGFVYKFHFIDFYNNSGQKGAPKVEYQKL
jgi:hypothetical protein